MTEQPDDDRTERELRDLARALFVRPDDTDNSGRTNLFVRLSAPDTETD